MNDIASLREEHSLRYRFLPSQKKMAEEIEDFLRLVPHLYGPVEGSRVFRFGIDADTYTREQFILVCKRFRIASYGAKSTMATRLRSYLHSNPEHAHSIIRRSRRHLLRLVPIVENTLWFSESNRSEDPNVLPQEDYTPSSPAFQAPEDVTLSTMTETLTKLRTQMVDFESNLTTRKRKHSEVLREATTGELTDDTLAKLLKATEATEETLKLEKEWKTLKCQIYAIGDGTIRTCPVCYEEFTPSTKEVLTGCGHVVCSTCVTQLKNKCPVCREPFDHHLKVFG